MSTPPTIKLPQLSLTHQNTALRSRDRRGSIVKVEEVGGRVEELLDRSAYLNINANWVNAKGVRASEWFECSSCLCHAAGAWLIHVVLVFTGKIIIDTIPGMTQQISWTLVNLIYLAVSVQIIMYTSTSCLTLLVVVSHVPLGHRHPIRQRTTCRCLR